MFVSTADDGQNVFLSSINARCLIKVFLLFYGKIDEIIL